MAEFAGAAVDLSERRRGDGAPTFYFFLLSPGAPDATRYQHPAIALAEGLAALGLPFHANIDHWTPAPGAAPLFRADPAVDPNACTAVIFTSDWLEAGRPIPDRLFAGPDRPISVYIDHQDGSRIYSMRPDFPQFDIVLRAHFGRLTTYRPSFRPWAFGLSNRIIESTQPRDSSRGRTPRMLVSYRHTRIPHGLRTYMDRRFVNRLDERLPSVRYVEDPVPLADDPLGDHLWRQTGRRHSSRYYSALRESTASACFGGYFIPRLPHDERNVVSRTLKRALTALRLPSRRMTQFDSWRLWESLAAGCATIHLDLEKYGAVFPVMPRNWEHYVGLDLDRLDEDVERLRSDASLLERIGAAGRVWSLAAYAPVPTAHRFLSLIGRPVHTT